MAEEVLQLVGLIGDEDSVVGFLLGGIGHQTITPPLQTVTSNVFVVDKETPADEIEDAFRTLVRRTDVGIVLITRLVADRIRHTLDIRERSNQVYPIVLEIPSALDAFHYTITDEDKQCRNIATLPKKK